MNCDKALELMSCYVDDELDREEEKQLLRHLDSCEECRKEFELIKEITSQLSEVEEVELPDGYHKELMGKLENKKVTKLNFGKRNHKYTKYTSIAAAVAVVAVVGSVGLTGANMNKSYDEAATEMVTASTTSASGASRAVATAGEAMVVEEAMEEMDSFENVTIERKQIKTGFISISVESFDDAIGLIEDKIVSEGGYVENYSSYIYYEDIDNDISLKDGQVSVRVDKNFYEDTFDYIKTIGEVNSENESVEDVTSDYVDVAARLRVKEAEEERLVQLLDDAKTIEDIIAIESKLADTRSYVESLQSQLNYWDKEVDYSTISVSVTEKRPQAIKNINNSFVSEIGESFTRSINFVIDGFQYGILAIVTMSIPTIIGLGVLFVVYKVLRKWWRKRKGN